MPFPSAEPAIPKYMSVRLVSQICAHCISLTDVTSAVSTDDTLQQVIHLWSMTGHINRRSLMPSTLKLEFMDGQLVWGGRLVIPSTLQQRILCLAHTGNPGMVRMKRSLHQVYWWQHLDAQVEQVVYCCNGCQQSEKSTSLNPVLTQLCPKPTKHWERLGLDIAGPFDIAPQNMKFVVALIDYYLGYPELLLRSNMGAALIIR